MTSWKACPRSGGSACSHHCNTNNTACLTNTSKMRHNHPLITAGLIPVSISQPSTAPAHQIMYFCCSYGWDLDWPCLEAALSTLDKERRKPNFGNAGSVSNLLSAAAVRMEERNKHLTPAERSAALPAPVDFLTDADAAAAAAGGAGAAANIFADLIGCQSVLGKLKEWQAIIKASQGLGLNPLESFELNFLFVGSPGGSQGPTAIVIEAVS